MRCPEGQIAQEASAALTTSSTTISWYRGGIGPIEFAGAVRTIAL
jgi:hypothetical protein